MDNIDFVIIWVDGSDPEWKKDKNKYKPNKDTDSREERYRDWDNLRFWFRSVEKYAPWVHKIYFVTCGHYPKWLNLKAEKLVHVKHSDYMKSEYLPTFSANPIELNICFIKDLAEHVVFFNDDMFLTNNVEPAFFFENGKPVHQARLHAVLPQEDGVMEYLHFNDVIAINRNFNIKESINLNKNKWFSLKKNGFSTVLQNIYESRYVCFPGFANEHLPVPFLKSTMLEVWEKEYDLLHETSTHKFRDMRDVNQYIFRYWQLASGNFEPRKSSLIGRRYTLGKDNSSLFSAIRNHVYPMVCLNDGTVFGDYELFEKTKEEIISVFEEILPEKSSFEV